MVWVQDAPEEISRVDLDPLRGFEEYQPEGSPSPTLDKTYDDDETESDSEDSDSGSEDSDDSSEEEDDELSESDDDDSEESSDDESENEEPDIFEYPDVIEGASKIGDVPNLFDEDIGGQTIDSASIVAAGAVGSAIFGKRNNIVIGIAVAGVLSYIMYLLYAKIADLRKEISNLERQQEMGLNDKDVQEISTQVLEDFLREGVNNVADVDVTDSVIDEVIDDVLEERTYEVVDEGIVDEGIVDNVVDELPDEVVDEVSDEVVDEVSDEVPKEVVSDVINKVVDDVLSDVEVAEVVVIPNVIADIIPDVIPDVIPDFIADVIPDVVDEVVADVNLPKKRGRPRKK